MFLRLCDKNDTETFEVTTVLEGHVLAHPPNPANHHEEAKPNK